MEKNVPWVYLTGACYLTLRLIFFSLFWFHPLDLPAVPTSFISSKPLSMCTSAPVEAAWGVALLY